MSNDNNTDNIPNNDGHIDVSNNSQLGGAGFEEEGGIRAEAEDRKPVKDTQTFAKNLKSVFGSGVGRVSIILFAFVFICVIAFAYRGFSNNKPVNASKSKVDLPVSPRSDKSAIEPVTEKELVRRSQQAQKEAESAANKGSTYQPAFDPHILKEGEENAPEAPVAEGSAKDAKFNIESDADAAKNRANAGSPPPPSGLSVDSGGGGNANAGKKNNQQEQAEAQRELQRQQKLEQEYQTKLKARDAYIKDVRQKIADQAKDIIGSPDVQTTVANQGTYGRAIYYSENDASSDGGADNSGEPNPGANSEVGAKQSKTSSNAKIKPLIKTGNILYAELDSEVNTDDGSDVFATIRGGVWNGSKLIGKIIKEPDNIALKFSILAPQDDRPTMAINAMAMREEDAKLGVAEDIDRHILSRYGSLAVASLMSGYGKAYARAGTETIILPNGQVVQTSGDPTTKQVVGQSVGEMGTAMSNEIRKNFNRPTTYSTPAQHGLGIYFMSDVLPPKN